MAELRLNAFPGWITNLSLTQQIVYLAAAAGIIVAALAAAWLLKKRARRKLAAEPADASQAAIQSLLKLVTGLDKNSRTVLLAANRLADLPVTVPVNLAVHLAKAGTCLLIDLDTRRDALAAVFELHLQIDASLKVSSLPAGIDNLFIWPARHFTTLKHMNLRQILEAAEKKYDFILLYAPYLTTLPDRKQIASCSGRAIAFVGDAPKDDRLVRLLNDNNCKILRMV